MSITSQIPAAQTPGLLDSIIKTGGSGVTWLTTNAKSLAGSASGTAGKAWTAVSEFFCIAAQKTSAYLSIGKNTVLATIKQVKALPNSTKVVLAAAMTAAVVVGGLLTRCFEAKSPAPPTQPAPAAAPTQPAPAAAPTQPAPALSLIHISEPTRPY